MDHEFSAAVLRDRLSRQLGGFSGREVAELFPGVGAHDPVVEAIVGSNMNSGRCHRLNFR